MIRVAAAAVVTLVVAGCGGGGGAHRPAGRPPPATVTTAAGTHTLTVGSYCWTTAAGSDQVQGCGDSGAPATFPGLATVRVRRGETIVIRLAFTPTAPVEVSVGTRTYHLAAAPTLRLRVHRGGLLQLDPRRGSDDVAYFARLITGPLPPGSA